MRHFFSTLGCVVLTVFSTSAFAGTVLSKEEIPENVMASFSKKHPNAVDITAERKTHFKQELFLINFKETKADEKQVVYYRVNGHLYVNGNEIDTSKASVEIPAAGYDALKAAFGDYDIKEAILIVNPNGAGEEYDLVINAAGKVWHVSLDRNGSITQQQE
jgi:hypothetical protein